MSEGMANAVCAVAMTVAALAFVLQRALHALDARRSLRRTEATIAGLVAPRFVRVAREMRRLQLSGRPIARGLTTSEIDALLAAEGQFDELLERYGSAA